MVDGRGVGETIRWFAGLMRQEEDQVSLLDAALLIARTEYPRLELAAQREQFARLARQLRADPQHSPFSNIEALNDLLFRKQGFRGNEEEYDDPRNSFLNDVLERRMGIPITLSLVYMELGRRHGLPIQGVGFPGHFIVKYVWGQREILIDPYHQGAILSRDDCANLLKSYYSDDAELQPEYLAPSTKKQILARMLNNLKSTFFRREQYDRVLTMIEMGLAIDPASSHHIHDRGVVYFLLRRYAQAAADLNAYLTLSPPNHPGVQSARTVLHRIRSLMN
jgi:regulator of sirC expression with transglutaminase-like and TPR domain